MIQLKKVGINLLIETTEDTLIGTEIYVNDYLKFTVQNDGLVSNRLEVGADGSPVAFVIAKYNDRLFMINRNKFNEEYGNYFSTESGEGVQESQVIWYTEDKTTHELTQIGTGFYYALENGEPMETWDLYCKLVLKEDGNFYIYCYNVI